LGNPPPGERPWGKISRLTEGRRPGRGDLVCHRCLLRSHTLDAENISWGDAAGGDRHFADSSRRPGAGGGAARRASAGDVPVVGESPGLSSPRRASAARHTFAVRGVEGEDHLLAHLEADYSKALALNRPGARDVIGLPARASSSVRTAVT